jgi:hypothetical protein
MHAGEREGKPGPDFGYIAVHVLFLLHVIRASCPNPHSYLKTETEIFTSLNSTYALFY